VITIKIKKSDSQILKIEVNTAKDLVRDLKERAFKKERDEGKLIRLIFQGKPLLDKDLVSKYSKLICHYL
jgi:hypothetical protein